jgi:hypothetical protein
MEINYLYMDESESYGTTRPSYHTFRLKLKGNTEEHWSVNQDGISLYLHEAQWQWLVDTVRETAISSRNSSRGWRQNHVR